jgi:hypothetical protein
MKDIVRILSVPDLAKELVFHSLRRIKRGQPNVILPYQKNETTTFESPGQSSLVAAAVIKGSQVWVRLCSGFDLVRVVGISCMVFSLISEIYCLWRELFLGEINAPRGAQTIAFKVGFGPLFSMDFEVS